MENIGRSIIIANVKNAKNVQCMESVVKEIQEWCTERGEELPYNINQNGQTFGRCV